MGAGAWSEAGIERLAEVMAGHTGTGAGDVPGLVWLLARRGEVHAGAAGVRTAEGGEPIARDEIFRISSMTKPITAVGALILVEECGLRLDEPVDDLLPELADRRVLADPHGALDDTVPAERPVSVRDLLTFRLGLGLDFTAWGNQPSLAAAAELGLGAGPPAPAGPPEPDEWMRRLGTLPLEHQPGERWLYHVGADVLGVLVARAAGRPLEAFLRERIFDPLGMVDTGFSVPGAGRDRLGPCYWTDLETGARTVYDPPDGQWTAPPAFPSGGGGLVSTVDDYLAFATMLRAGGVYHGQRILSRPTIEAMTTNQLTAGQLAASAPSPDGSVGWGLGLGVRVRRTGPAWGVGTYGWDGGLGSQWATDPDEDLIGLLMTNRSWTSAFPPPPAFQDFWTCAYAAFDD
ncbi:MAG TPA: serine hydrolase domain-containing protein [Acidimicrobiales bacterium]|nr:serine hydrolase domain-containing protein [Acidimicrobiales bacterium]